MPSEASHERLNEILKMAQGQFAARGYRRTQIADVARGLGVSPGLIYRYFESKETLFHAALQQALEPERPLAPGYLPIPTPEKGATLVMLRAHLETWVAAPLLKEALAHDDIDDPRSELEGLVRTFYDGAERRRKAADLIERSALDLPELAALWFGEIRHAHFERLANYMQRRMKDGHLRSLPNPEVAARIVIEIVVFFARHRHRDPYEKLDDESVRNTVTQFVLAALVP